MQENKGNPHQQMKKVEHVCTKRQLQIERTHTKAAAMIASAMMAAALHGRISPDEQSR